MNPNITLEEYYQLLCKMPQTSYRDAIHIASQKTQLVLVLDHLEHCYKLEMKS